MKNIKTIFQSNYAKVRTFLKKAQPTRHFLIHTYLYKGGVLFDDVVLHTEVIGYPNKATITTNIAAKYAEFNIDRVKIDIPIRVTAKEAATWVEIPKWYSDAVTENERQRKIEERKPQNRNRRRKSNSIHK